MKQEFYTKVQQVDNALSSDQVKSELAVFIATSIADNKSLCDYFFKRVQSIQWFDILEKNKYFSINGILFDSNSNACFWNVLDYLERVSEQIVKNPQYGEKLIEIIESIVQFSIKRKKDMGQGINNYHIWWYCVKILNNLPPKIIKNHLPIEKFSTWLSVWTGHIDSAILSISDIAVKLLPKFLKDDFGPDYKYAEAIIDVITEIKGGGKSFPPLGKEDAVMAWEPYWLQDAFRKYNKNIAQKCSYEITLNLADKLEKALEYRQSDSSENIRVGSDLYKVSVSRIPKEGFKNGKIDYENNSYKYTIGQFPEDKIKDIDIDHDFWSLQNIKTTEIINPIQFNASNNDEMVRKIEQNLPKNIDWTKAIDLKKKLGFLYKNLHADYSQIWIKSLALGDNEHSNAAENVLTRIIRDLLLTKCGAKPEEGKLIIDALLSKRYKFPIFKRFVLLCIDRYWDNYPKHLDEILESDYEILKEPDCEVEMHDILKNHHLVFSPAVKLKLKELINDVPEYYIEDGEKSVAYWKFKWLSPLRENDDFKTLYEEAKQKAELKDGVPYEPEHTSIKSGILIHNTPISKDDILKKPIFELVKDLNDFKGARYLHDALDGEPDQEGLAETLQAAVKDNPKKFTDEIDAFHKTNYFYVHSLFRGFKEAWNANTDIDWEKIFNFSIKYFDRGNDAILKEALAAQGEDSGKGKYIWLVEDIVDLIADGCSNDKRSFDPKHHDAVEKIFELVLHIPMSEKQPDTQRDALTYALNTTIGRIIRSYISFSLHKARITKKTEDDWGKNKFERFFDKGIEADIWFGGYLPQMNYLDNNYTGEKIISFAKNNTTDFKWKRFMEGYLTMAQVYKDVYGFMRQNYLKAINCKNLEKRVDQRLVQHLCIGYLNFNESLKKENKDGSESLFYKMLTVGRTDRWLEVPRFFWSLTGQKVSDDAKTKIVKFWRWTHKNQNIVKDNTGNDYDSFLGSMADLTILLDNIDEKNEGWLMLCVPHIEKHHNSSFFIRSLKKFNDPESIKKIGKIFKKILENTTPTFPQDDITIIVRRVYEKGDRNDADDICNTYGRRGIHFLKPLWDEFQKT